MIYLLTYDLRAPGRNYDALYKELARINAGRVLQSVWIANLNQTPIQVRDVFRTYIDENDRLGVYEITANWASFNAMAPGVAILKAYLP